MSARPILSVVVTVDDAGRLEVKIDSDQEPSVQVAILEQVVQHVGAPQDRATETDSFGAKRRKV